MPPEVVRARKLRRTMSCPEVLLRKRLRGSTLGIRFGRRHPIGSDYMADFYCAQARVVIEVDGEAHGADGAPERDVLRDADAAAQAIVSFVATAPPPPAQEGRRSPSPFRGGSRTTP